MAQTRFGGRSFIGVLRWSVFGILATSGLNGQVTLTSSFKNSTESGWTLTGDAHLTSGIEDPPGNGWLRLTDNRNNQASFVYYNNPFPLGSGFRVIFNYAFWGNGNGSPADGITFALFDASVTAPHAGAFGGSLGYAQKTNIPGVPSGVLGIGLDSFGNYSNPTEGRIGGPGFVPFTATIRGPGDGTANQRTSSGKDNYGYLVSSGALAPSLLDLGNAASRPETPADFRQATLSVDTSQIADGHVPVTLDIVQGNNASVRIINTDLYAQLLDFYGSPANFPTVVRFGFTGGTGGSVDYHDIRLLTVEVTNIPGADLVIAKSHAGTFNRGAVGNYSLSVRNRGRLASSGVVSVTDTLPAGLTPRSASGVGWTCSFVGQNVTCSRSDSLGSSASYPLINIEVNVATDAPSFVENVASVSGGNDTDTTNNTANDPTTITGGPNLVVAKSHTGNFYQGQKGVTFTLIVTNEGTLPTSGLVTVQDNYPLALPPVSAAGPGWTCLANGTACGRSDSLAPNASYPPITVTADVDPNAPPEATNVVVVNGGNDQDNTDNQANDPIIILPGPDLTIRKSHTGNFAQGQQGVTYSIVVTNGGGVPTTGEVTVGENLPAGLTLVGAAGPGWTCTLRVSPGTTTCSRIDPLPPAASYPAIVITANVSPIAPGSVTNPVVVSGGGDINNANNTAVDPTTILPSPDLTITKSHAGSFLIGTNQPWTITVSNVGAAVTSGTINVSDTVPVGLALVNVSGTGWTCQSTAPAWTCSRSDALAPTVAFPPITVTVNVLPGAPSSVTNIVTVTGGGDLTPGNNTATDITTIGPGADLIVAKTHSGAFRQGAVGTYQMVVSNIGLAPTVGVVTVDDPLAPSLTLAAPPQGSGWTCNPTGPVHCQRTDSLINGSSYPSITITVNISPSAPAVVTNTVTTGGGGDVNPLNNTDADTVDIGAGADLTIAKTHAANFVQGQLGVFTITVSNVGTTPSNGEVRVLDFLPVGLTPVSVVGSGWTCAVSAVPVCSRSDSLPPGAAFPPISLTVQVGLTGSIVTGRGLLEGNVRNPAEVRGENDHNPLNNFAEDHVTVLAGPDLAIAKTHGAAFGANGVGTYTINVRNIGGAPTVGLVIVSDNFPNVLSITSATGAGWTCSVQSQTMSCNRSDALSPGASYPPVSISVNVSADASGTVHNRAAVSGGGDVDLGNNTAIDPADVVPGPDVTILKSHTGAFNRGASGVFTLSVSNAGGQPTSGLVNVSDLVPDGLLPIAATGTGWSCSITGQSLTCSRSDALPPGTTYPVISLSVNIAPSALGTITNTATVAGGGECPSCRANNTSEDTVILDSSSGGGPLSCVMSAVPPIVRREGLTELTGDILLTCTGGTPTPIGMPVQKTNLQVFLNTNITSRLNADASFSEALLLIDDPWPAQGSSVPSGLTTPSGAGVQRLCTPGQNILGTGTGVGVYDGLTPSSCNLYLGRQAGVNSIVFPGVSIDPPGNRSRLIRITNVRANATQLGNPTSPVPSQVIAFVSASPQSSLPLSRAQVVVAFVAPGLVMSTSDVVNLPQCLSQNSSLTSATSKFSISVKEGFASAFNRRTYATSSDPNLSPGPVAQNIPGFQYHSESGFYNPVVLGPAGLADFGSRLMIRFDNVGTGVSLLVPTVVSLKFGPGQSDLSGTLRLLSANNTGGAAFSPATATATIDGLPAAILTATSGSAVAIYEVLNSSETVVDSAVIPVGVSYVANTPDKLPSLGATTLSGSFAPISSVGIADATSSVPRFIGGSGGDPIFTIYSCTCTLLFPFVTNQLGFDTGIAIANTSRDPFGTPAQAGTVTVNYYGRTSTGSPAPAPQVSQVVSAGQTLAFTLSSGGSFGMLATPGFQGYVVARADFQFCHGFAFISDFGSNVVAEGYLGLVMDTPIGTRTGQSSESLHK